MFSSHWDLGINSIMIFEKRHSKGWNGPTDCRGLLQVWRCVCASRGLFPSFSSSPSDSPSLAPFPSFRAWLVSFPFPSHSSQLCTFVTLQTSCPTSFTAYLIVNCFPSLPAQNSTLPTPLSPSSSTLWPQRCRDGTLLLQQNQTLAWKMWKVKKKLVHPCLKLTLIMYCFGACAYCITKCSVFSCSKSFWALNSIAFCVPHLLSSHLCNVN